MIPVRMIIFRKLVQANGRIVTKDDLLTAAYQDDPNGGPEKAEEVLRVCIHRIRKLVPAGTLVNHYGVGYALDKQVAEKYKDVFPRRQFAA